MEGTGRGRGGDVQTLCENLVSTRTHVRLLGCARLPTFLYGPSMDRADPPGGLLQMPTFL
eukprot:6855621-Lingulodinium_polyedra.AAC.1